MGRIKIIPYAIKVVHKAESIICPALNPLNDRMEGILMRGKVVPSRLLKRHLNPGTRIIKLI